MTGDLEIEYGIYYMNDEYILTMSQQSWMCYVTHDIWNVPLNIRHVNEFWRNI